jgi:hypothetical protein
MQFVLWLLERCWCSKGICCGASALLCICKWFCSTIKYSTYSSLFSLMTSKYFVPLAVPVIALYCNILVTPHEVGAVVLWAVALIVITDGQNSSVDGQHDSQRKLAKRVAWLGIPYGENYVTNIHYQQSLLTTFLLSGLLLFTAKSEIVVHLGRQKQRR